MGASFGDDDHIHRKPQRVFVPSKQLPQSSPNPVSLNGVADFLTGDDGHSGIGQAIGKIDQVEILTSGSTAFFVKI